MITVTALAGQFMPSDNENTPVLLNPAYIIRFYEVHQSYGDTYTRIETVGAHFNVTETPQQMLQAIGLAKAEGNG